jgi:hypothetical protein
MPSPKERLAELRRRRPLIDHAVRTQEHYGEVKAGQQAGAVTYFGFLSFFPILALAFFVVGWVAKVYAGACALGPALLVPVDWTAPFDIELRILSADGGSVFAGQASTGNMRRMIPELIEYLRRDNAVPAGTVLLTGTGIVPPDDITLQPGQSVEITIAGVGKLRNPVRTSD